MTMSRDELRAFLNDLADLGLELEPHQIMTLEQVELLRDIHLQPGFKRCSKPLEWIRRHPVYMDALELKRRELIDISLLGNLSVTPAYSELWCKAQLGVVLDGIKGKATAHAYNVQLRRARREAGAAGKRNWLQRLLGWAGVKLGLNWEYYTILKYVRWNCEEYVHQMGRGVTPIWANMDADLQ